MLDGKGRLPNKITGKALDCGARYLGKAPDTSLAIAYNAGFRFHAGKHELADLNGNNRFNDLSVALALWDQLVFEP